MKSDTQRSGLKNNDFRYLLKNRKASAPKTKIQILKLPAINNCEVKNPQVKTEQFCKQKNYSKRKKPMENTLLELTKKYRDRAKERRDKEKVDNEIDGNTFSSSSVKSNATTKEMREEIIKNSKFLGGDMQHTHLVKGLDYALLQKVREEINRSLESKESFDNKEIEENNHMEFKTRLARNLYDITLGPKYFRGNSKFTQGRMSYLVDLNEEMKDNYIPTTVLRCRTDLPIETTLSSKINDSEISKLTNILKLLEHKKGKKKSKTFEENLLVNAAGENSEKCFNEAASISSMELKNEKIFDSSTTSEDGKIKKLLSRLNKEIPIVTDDEPYTVLNKMVQKQEHSDESEEDIGKIYLKKRKKKTFPWEFDSFEEYDRYLQEKFAAEIAREEAERLKSGSNDRIRNNDKKK